MMGSECKREVMEMKRGLTSIAWDEKGSLSTNILAYFAHLLLS